MVSRLALAGCAAASLWLAGPAVAAPNAEPALEVPQEVKPAIQVRKVVRRRIRVAVLPPVRPDDLDGEQVTAHAAQATTPDVPAWTAPAGNADPAGASPSLRSSLASAEDAQVVTSTEAAVADVPLPPVRPDLLEMSSPRAAIVAVLPPERPAFEADPVETASLPEPSPPPAQPSRSLFGALFGTPPSLPSLPVMRSGRDGLNDRIAYHAKLNEVPEDLVHRVVIRESKYNPRAVGRGGALGLMQIKHATARSLGYGGTPAGLLDAETNLTYAVKYLAGAYRVAGGNYDRAVMNYARGYYYEAKRQRLSEAGYVSTRRVRSQRGDRAVAALQADTVDTAPLPTERVVNVR